MLPNKSRSIGEVLLGRAGAADLAQDGRGQEAGGPPVGVGQQGLEGRSLVVVGDGPAQAGDRLVLVYTPRYDPEANRIAWLWRALRRTVTHNHQRVALEPLLADADRWAAGLSAAAVLSQIGSPGTPEQDLADAA